MSSTERKCETKPNEVIKMLKLGNRGNFDQHSSFVTQNKSQCVSETCNSTSYKIRGDIAVCTQCGMVYGGAND